METLSLPGLDALGWSLRAGTVAISIHHTVTMAASEDREEERDHVHVIDNYHQSLGWGGIGYHVLVFPSGRLYQSHANNRIPRAGVAHRNGEIVHLAFVGDFTATQPTAAAIAGAREAIALLRQEYGDIPLMAHREVATPDYPTACPGDNYRAWIGQLEEGLMPTREDPFYAGGPTLGDIHDWAARGDWLTKVLSSQLDDSQIPLMLIRQLQTEVANLWGDVEFIKQRLAAIKEALG